jgi:addiction module HigA family antidote
MLAIALGRRSARCESPFGYGHKYNRLVRRIRGLLRGHLAAERGPTQSTGSPREDGISFLWTVLRADRVNIRFASMISGESVLFGGKEHRSMSKLSTITDPEFLADPTPGEILPEDFLEPLALSQTALADKLRVSPRRINEIVIGERTITADTARFFGRTSGFFLGLQADYDLMARRRELGGDLELIEPGAA